MVSLLRLLDSYILLDAAGILQVSFLTQACLRGIELTPKSHGPSICSGISTALQTSKPNSDTSKRLLTTLSLLIRLSPITALAPLLLDSGIFQHTLKALEDDKASGMILAAHLEILARIAIADPGVFLGMVAEAARREGRDGHKMLEETLDAMWRNFDYVAEARGRKAVAMGAGSLLTTVSSAV